MWGPECRQQEAEGSAHIRMGNQVGHVDLVDGGATSGGKDGHESRFGVGN